MKDFALNFYPNARDYQMTGMKPVLNYLNIYLQGTHHLGMDDVSNIAKIIFRLRQDGAIIKETAIRNDTTGYVKYLMKKKIQRGQRNSYRNNNNDGYNYRGNGHYRQYYGGYKQNHGNRYQ